MECQTGLLESGGDFLLMSRVERLRSERGALEVVVLVQFESNRRVGVVRFPTPLANRYELKRNAFFPAESGALATDEQPVADSDVRGDEEACGAVGRENAFRRARREFGCGFPEFQSRFFLR